MIMNERAFVLIAAAAIFLKDIARLPFTPCNEVHNPWWRAHAWCRGSEL